MAKFIAVYSMKGGVGKTTLAVNLAYCSAVLGGHRTLLWDLDAQGGSAFLLGQAEASHTAKKLFSGKADPADLAEPTRWPGLDLIAADLSLRHLESDLAEADKPKRLRKLLRTLEDRYDRIILDCPPGLGEISEHIFRAVELIVAPVEPNPLALRTLDLVEARLAEEDGRKPRIMPVLSMVDRRKSLHRQVREAHPDWPAIPQASAVERMAVEQAPVVDFARSSPGARAIVEVWRAVEGEKPAAPLAKIPAKTKR
ncbi:ParA family protein [Novosphingobium sp. PS1R-30]|uniref:ParA family protein n=1 Tax=Novosphingobium anseongense TaxID=3133436 RepID=A0ABU8RRQ3_9SPHN